MGKRGPAPKPSALKLIQGTYRKDRAAHNEPTPDVSIPTCPSFLKPAAKREWRRITKELEALGLISQIDRAVLAVYCQAYATWQEMEKIIERDGAVQSTSTGYLAQHPAVSMRDKAIEQMMKAAAQFGFTPSSRTRVSVPEKKKDDTNPFIALAR